MDVRWVRELNFIHEVELLEERDRGGPSHGDSIDWHGEVRRVGLDGGAVRVFCGFFRAAHSQDVGIGRLEVLENLEVRVVGHGEIARHGHLGGSRGGAVDRDPVGCGEVVRRQVQGGGGADAGGRVGAVEPSEGDKRDGLWGEAFGGTCQSDRRRSRVAKRRLPRATRGGEGFQSARVRGKPRARDARTARTLMIFIVFEF